MKIRFFVLLTLTFSLFLMSCKSTPGDEMGNSSYEELLLSQEQLIEGLNSDLSNLEALLEELRSSNPDGNERLEDLISQRDFLMEQLAMLQAHYDEVQGRSSGSSDALSMAVAEIKAQLADEMEQGNVEYFIYNGMIILHVNNPVLFSPGSAALRDENKDLLNRISKVFAYFPDRIIRVEGHTATGPDSSQYPTAWELGAARAVNVVRYFQEQAGVEPERLVAVSFGEWRPLSSNDTEEGRINNRRIEIVILNRPLYQWQELLTE